MSPRRYAVLIALAVASFSSQSGASDSYPKGELLVEPTELATRLERFTILDARPRAAYEAGTPYFVMYQPESTLSDYDPGPYWQPATAQDDERNLSLLRDLMALCEKEEKQQPPVEAPR